METENQKEVKGRLSWLIPILEFVVIIAYFAIGYKGIINGVSNMDIGGMFEGVRTAIIFLIIAIAVLTVLCFLPLFKSKTNDRWAIWNVIWIIFTVYSMIG